jgi:hypothetical protein
VKHFVKYFEIQHSKIESKMSNTNPNTASSSQTKLPANVVPVNLEERKKKNDAWISAYKKTHGIKKQAVLPSATMQHNEWAIKSGWSMSDATTWRSLCEKAKYAMDDIEGQGILCLIAETIDIANHCDGHPVGLIHWARTEHGRPVWDLESVDYLKANMLPAEAVHHVDDDDDTVQSPPTTPNPADGVTCPGAPKRKRLTYEASQPFEDIDADCVRD